MQVIPYKSLTATPWVNGGGITREIAAERDDHGILWRISLADVSQEGPFSHFAGLQRILTVFDGGGMLLETSDGPLTAAPMMPLPFAGDLPVEGRLPFGPIRDLNVIFRAAHILADVRALKGPTRILPEPQRQILFLVAGAAQIGERSLPALTTILDPDAPVDLGPEASALHITLAPATVVSR